MCIFGAAPGVNVRRLRGSGRGTGSTRGSSKQDHLKGGSVDRPLSAILSKTPSSQRSPPPQMMARLMICRFGMAIGGAAARATPGIVYTMLRPVLDQVKPIWAIIDRFRPKSCRFRPSLERNRLNLDRLRPSVPDFGQIWAELEQTWLHSAKLGLISARFGSTGFGPKPAILDRIWSIWPKFGLPSADFWTDTVQISGHTRSNIGPTLTGQTST